MERNAKIHKLKIFASGFVPQASQNCVYRRTEPGAEYEPLSVDVNLSNT